MLFKNPLLLIGLLGILLPILLHLLNRRTARPVPWGAMLFLDRSVSGRTRRIELEDTLLMAARCLLVGAIVLALARPFAPSGSRVPWGIVLPGLMAAIAALGWAGAAGSNRHRWLAGAISLALFAAVTTAILFEHRWNLRRLGGGGDQTVALLIDGSTSMGAQDKGKTTFDQAIDEARKVIGQSGAGTAFSIHLAGPSPTLLCPPTASRADLERALSNARPSDGMMALPAALAQASATLGDKGRRIVLLTDGQAVGWETGNSTAWASAKRSPEIRPQLVVRPLTPPGNLRNATVTSITFDRDTIGTDRPVGIGITISNTGTEAITPGGVQLRIGKTLLEAEAVGQLLPGESTTSRFEHQFDEAGGLGVTARVQVEDALPADDVLSRVVAVSASLKVLIVDGNPGGPYFERSGSFLEIALAAGASGEQSAHLSPIVLPATRLAEAGDFSGYDAVVLADVPRLPQATAALLAARVEAGAGLLIAPGKRADPQFYNTWLTAGGAPVAPAALDGYLAAEARLAPTSFAHRSLQKAATPGANDLGQVVITDYWKQTLPASGQATTIADLDNGSPFLTLGALGKGSVVLSALPFDHTSSNLVNRSSFLPLAHELIEFLAAPADNSRNLAPGAEIIVPLPSSLPHKRLAAIDPLGETRLVKVVERDRRAAARVGGDAIAGLYEIEIPAESRDRFTSQLTDGGTLPFAVHRPAEESDRTPVSESERAAAGQHFEILPARTTDDVLSALSGEAFGKELWRFLAIGALLLLLGETALARWISRSRHLGVDDSVDFALRHAPTAEFERQLERARGESL